MNNKLFFTYTLSRTFKWLTGALMLWLFALAGAQASTTTRVSVDSAGVEGNSYSYDPSISADGRYVAFRSHANNLVIGDVNGDADIFIHNTTTGTTTRVSVDSSGVEANGGSRQPSISADGSYVAFYSYATNLVAGDINGVSDIFVYDTTTGTTTRVSVDSSGLEGNGTNYEPSISADGRYVAFYSEANNLVTGDANGNDDIFIHDTTTGTTTRVSVDSNGVEGNGGSYEPSISADGRYVAFYSDANNLVTGDANGRADVFVHDTTTGTTTRVSVDSTGVEGNSYSYDSSISADGRYVIFSSDASNLVSGDTNGDADMFVYDTTTGTIARVSVDSSGVESNGGGSYDSSISADGRYVAFSSDADNLVTGDTNEDADVFVYEKTAAVMATPTSVPTMSQWGLLFMATLLGLFGFTRRKINMV